MSDSKTTDRPSGCVAVWQPGEKPDPGTMHWLAPDGTRWPATDREQAENAALVRSMRLTAETRGREPTPSKATPQIEALSHASGHTYADCELILDELRRIGWTVAPIGPSDAPPREIPRWRNVDRMEFDG